MPYQAAFQRGIHVVTTGAVFAQPVAELGWAWPCHSRAALHHADAAFRRGESFGAATAMPAPA